MAGLVLLPETAPPRLALALKLTPLVMPYALLICLTGALSGVLNSMGHFAVPALTPVILNLVLIGATMLVCPAWEMAGIAPVYALGGAVLLAGLVQLGAQIAACARRGMHLRLQLNWSDPHVRKVALLMAPALLGTGVTQLNVVVDRFLAGWLGSAAVGSLWYSQRLVYLPVGLFGVAMGVVCLPAMSRAWAREDHEAMSNSTTFALRHVLFLAVPCAALLSVAAVPIIRLLFERGAFDGRSVAETAWALAFYLPGIPAFCCAKVAVTPFYAQHDTKTPVKIAVLCMVINLLLNLILMQFLRQGGLALATTISSYLNVSLLLLLTWRRTRSLQAQRLSYAAIRIAVAAAAAAVAGRSVLRRVPAPPHWPATAALFMQLAACGVAAALVYLTVCLVLKSREPAELLGALRRKKP
jgi:putative peptidoglycan lipid II flippase